MIDFIAEVSSNHNRDLNRCKKFVDVAAKIGCSAIKFQLFKIDEMFAPEILQRSPRHKARKDWELPVEFLPEIKHQCRLNNIEFGCTPFYIEAVDELYPYVDFYKISSYDLPRRDGLLKEIAGTGKPVILSTGLATLDEVLDTVMHLGNSGCSQLKILHCVSCYPTRHSDCNLAAIETLRRTTGLSVGWSDHSVSPSVIYRAVHRWDASIIEFHLDIDKEGIEYAGDYNWLPGHIGEVIVNVNLGFSTDGNGSKEPSIRELETKEVDWRADVDGLRPVKSIREDYYPLYLRELK